MKTSFALICLLFCFNILYSQKLDKKTQKAFDADFVTADEYLDDNNYNAALPIFLKLLELDPDNANLQHRIGLCYIYSAHEKEKAIEYLEKAVRNTDLNAQARSPKERKASVDAFFHLGNAFHINYKFYEALKIYDGYLEKITELSNRDSLIEKTERAKEICKNAIELTKKPIPMTVENLGKAINSAYPEYSPFVNADETVLFFTSKREGSTGGNQTEDGNFYEDIYFSTKNSNGKWEDAKPISPNINSNLHDAVCGASLDGTEIFVYRDDGNIYSSKQLSMGAWSEPQSLGEFVNSKFNEKGASMSPDGNFLFFSSDRPEGYGGFDLYISKKLPNGEWGEAFNLGPNVNTEYDDIGPFFHPDGSTLYFASEGHNTMGGFDVFYTTINIEDATSTVPVNLGYPINTTGDDVFLCITPDGKRAYYSSYQKNGLGYTDICMILLQDPLNKSLTVLSGYVTKADTKEAAGISITLTDTETQETTGSFTPNASTGKYIFILKVEKQYSALYECVDYIPQSKIISVSKDSTYEMLNTAIKIPSVTLVKPTHAGKLIFEKDETNLSDAMKETLEKAVSFLRANKEAPVKYFVSNESDQKLAKSREDNVTEFLAKNGIDRKRIFNSKEICNSKQICEIHISEKMQKVESKKDISKHNKIDPAQILPNLSAMDTITKFTVGMTFTLDNILFPVNKSYLTEESYVIVNKLLDIMNKYPNLYIEISGHTDNTGSAARNKKLSKERAKGVADYLVLKGIKRERIQHAGYGSERPMVTNETADGKKLNRRVEIKILKD